MTPVEALAQAELHSAIARIEAALHLAFSGRAGRQRLARAIEGPDAADLEGDDALHAELSAALSELDRLEAIADCSGARLEEWLRLAGADMLDTSLVLSDKMRADPLRSLEAQARRARTALRNLRG